MSHELSLLRADALEALLEPLQFLLHERRETDDSRPISKPQRSRPHAFVACKRSVSKPSSNLTVFIGLLLQRHPPPLPQGHVPKTSPGGAGPSRLQCSTHPGGTGSCLARTH